MCRSTLLITLSSVEVNTTPQQPNSLRTRNSHRKRIDFRDAVDGPGRDVAEVPAGSAQAGASVSG